MKLKNNLKTIRLTREEEAQITRFLEEDLNIHRFSDLARAAIWEFLERRSGPQSSKKLSFLWEYDLTHGEITAILRGPQKRRLWLVGKILEHGRWQEIWEYLDIRTIQKDLPLLRMNSKTKKHWKHALQLWKKAA